MNLGNDIMITPLHLAAFGFFNEAGRELISLGADLNIKVSLEIEQGKHKIFLFCFSFAIFGVPKISLPFVLMDVLTGLCSTNARTHECILLSDDEGSASVSKILPSLLALSLD